MAKNNQANPQVLTFFLGTVTTTSSLPLLQLPKRFVVESMSLMNQVTIAANNTNYVTVALADANSSFLSIDTRAANQGTATALTGLAVSALQTAVVDHPAQYIDKPVGTNLKAVVTIGGTGQLTNANLTVYGYFL